MRYKPKNYVFLPFIVLIATSVLTAANLSITTYTDPNIQDYQVDDSLQVALASRGIIAEHFQTSPVGQNPITFGVNTSNATGQMPFPWGGTFATNDWYDTAIVYSFNVNSRWWNSNVLKDITIWVWPADNARRHYDFQVQYTLNDGTGVYYDATNPGSSNFPHITDKISDDPPVYSTAEGVGTKISITDIDVANVSQVWIWALPIIDGFQKVATTISEIDVNFESCGEYPEADFNADCKVDLYDLDYLAVHWLLNK
jgi:hypothetical protein